VWAGQEIQRLSETPRVGHRGCRWGGGVLVEGGQSPKKRFEANRFKKGGRRSFLLEMGQARGGKSSFELRLKTGLSREARKIGG